MIRAKINVIGMVQGVGFRYFTLKNAEHTGVKGFVKNLYDGSVYCEAEGTPEQIKEFCDLLKQGPSRSYIQKVVIEHLEYTGVFKYFDIR
jgi:acylphosphatase